MNEPDAPEKYSLTLVRLTEVRPATYSLEDAARLAGVHPERVRYYCRLGLFGQARAQPETEPVFDDDSLYELRRLERHRREHGMSRKTLRLVSALWQEIERLQAELRFLRDR